MLIELPSDRLRFILGGRSEFTVHNPLTGGRFTYSVSRVEARGRRTYQVRVLTNPDNTSRFSYLGRITQRGEFHANSRRIGPRALSSRSFAWIWRRTMALREIGPAEFLHTGRCGRCGRKLTVPESIKSGLGPVCAGRV